MNNDSLKFRVWDAANNSWEASDHSFYFVDEYGDLYEIDLNHDYYEIRNVGSDFIIQQCIGLKDKNGKLIYEGDILDFEEIYKGKKLSTHCSLEIIDFNLYLSYISFANPQRNWINGGHPFVASQSSKYEIIGNILENPELLEPSQYNQ